MSPNLKNCKKENQLYHDSPQIINDFTLYVYRIVLMPDSCEEKVFPFPAKEIKEGEVAANIPRCELDHMDPEDIMIVKFVLTYYLLKEDK